MLQKFTSHDQTLTVLGFRACCAILFSGSDTRKVNCHSSYGSSISVGFRAGGGPAAGNNVVSPIETPFVFSGGARRQLAVITPPCVIPNPGLMMQIERDTTVKSPLYKARWLFVVLIVVFVSKGVYELFVGIRIDDRSHWTVPITNSRPLLIGYVASAAPGVTTVPIVCSGSFAFLVSSHLHTVFLVCCWFGFLRVMLSGETLITRLSLAGCMHISPFNRHFCCAAPFMMLVLAQKWLIPWVAEEFSGRRYCHRNIGRAALATGFLASLSALLLSPRSLEGTWVVFVPWSALWCVACAMAASDARTHQFAAFAFCYLGLPLFFKRNRAVSETIRAAV
jgi:hypothetical protein